MGPAAHTLGTGCCPPLGPAHRTLAWEKSQGRPVRRLQSTKRIHICKSRNAKQLAVGRSREEKLAGPHKETGLSQTGGSLGSCW